MLLIELFAFVLPPGRSNGLEPQLGPPEDGAGAVQLQRQRRWILMFFAPAQTRSLSYDKFEAVLSKYVT